MIILLFIYQFELGKKLIISCADLADVLLIFKLNSHNNNLDLSAYNYTCNPFNLSTVSSDQIV